MMESKGPDRCSGSGASTSEKSEVSQSSKIVLEEEKFGNLKFSGAPNVRSITQKEPCMRDDNFKRPRSQNHPVPVKRDGIQESATDNSNSDVLQANEMRKDSHACVSEMMDARTNLEGTTDLVGVVTPVRDQYSHERNGDTNYDKEIMEVDMQLEDDNEQMISRSADTEIKTRSLSPGIQSENGNKRPAIICDFFARGWCIKGSSCRFLHKKDYADNIILKDDGEVAVVDSERKMDPVEGSKDVCERLMASSAGNFAAHSPVPLERTLTWEHGESKRCQLDDKHRISSLEKGYSTFGSPLDHQLLASLRDDPGCITSFKEVDRERQRHILPIDKVKNHALLINRGSSHLNRNSLFPEYGSGSSGSVMSMGTNRHTTFSYASNTRELACNRSQFMHNETSLASPSLKERSNTSLQTPDMSSSRGMVKSFSLLDASPSQAQMLLDGGRDSHASRSASLMHSISPCSGPKPECLSPIKASGDTLLCGQFKSKFPKYNWEPSVPFQPSFFITQSISSTGNLYDPLRDSIEETNVGDISSRVCANSEGASILNSPVQHKYQNSSLSSHSGRNENILDKNCSKDEKDILLTGVETVGTSDTDQQSGTLAGEENLPGLLNMREISSTNKIDTGCEATNQGDGARQKKDMKVDRTRENGGMEIESKRDKDMPKESKALRQLRASLVDMVKDLLKPSWHEGHLSKDAHNVIVKKAVDKVLGTIQPHLIPSTIESVKQYLSISQPKIVKLVEAYVEKYGKS